MSRLPVFFCNSKQLKIKKLVEGIIPVSVKGKLNVVLFDKNILNMPKKLSKLYASI